MKNIIYILFLALPSMMISCTGEDDIFERENNAQVSEMIAGYKKLLTSSEHGWKMQYYPDTLRVGGYNLFFDFTEEGRVRMIGDFRAIDTAENIFFEATKSYESTYSFNEGEGIILDFDTYNILHALADPGLFQAGVGLKGDFELIVQRATLDSLICIGRKWKQPMVLVKANAGDRESMDEIYENDKRLDPSQEGGAFFRNLHYNDEGLATFLYAPVARSIEYFFTDQETGETASGQVGAILTTTGFSLAREVEINGVKLKDFTYNADKGSYTFGDNGELTIEHESVVDFGDAWSQLYQFSSVSLYYPSSDFNKLIDSVKNYEKDFETLQFYWDSGPIVSFIFLKKTEEGKITPRWYHSVIESVENPTEDCAIFKPNIDDKTKQKVIINEGGSQEELYRLFVDDTPSKKKIDQIFDFIYDPKGFTIIPLGDGLFYMISKSESNYWMLMRGF